MESVLFSRLLEWLIDESVPQELRTEAAIVLGSLAWGTEENIQQLVSAGAVPVLLRGLSNPCLPHVEACLRCLRTIFMAPNPPVQFIYQVNQAFLIYKIFFQSLLQHVSLCKFVVTQTSEHYGLSLQETNPIQKLQQQKIFKKMSKQFSVKFCCICCCLCVEWD